MIKENLRVESLDVQVHSNGDRAVLYRVANGTWGRGFVAVHQVPFHLRQYLYTVVDNNTRDAFFRSRQSALQMIEWLSRNVSEEASHD